MESQEKRDPSYRYEKPHQSSRTSTIQVENTCFRPKEQQVQMNCGKRAQCFGEATEGSDWLKYEALAAVW